MPLPFLTNYQFLGPFLKEMDSSPTTRFVSNPHLKLLEDDMLFHIGMKAGDRETIRKLFGDVKVKSNMLLILGEPIRLVDFQLIEHERVFTNNGYAFHSLCAWEEVQIA